MSPPTAPGPAAGRHEGPATGVVQVVLPRALEPLAGGRRRLEVPVPEGGTVADVLDALEREHPVLGRRVRDETRSLRRFVNVYLDGDDVRRLAGTACPVADGQELRIIQSVAGG